MCIIMANQEDFFLRIWFIFMAKLQWIVTRDVNFPQQQSNIIEIYQAIQNLTEWASTQPGVSCDSWILAFTRRIFHTRHNLPIEEQHPIFYCNKKN
jgi:hypothetical protein